MGKNLQVIQTGQIAQPKFKGSARQWRHARDNKFLKSQKNSTTVMFNFVERRKSLFFAAAMERQGFIMRDLGDHIYEDVTVGKRYGNRAQCNPIYFTAGSIVRNLEVIREETGLSKEEIVDKYVFLGGGGQCGPCRYGMYSEEYYKVTTEAGYEDFRILIFSSDSEESAGSDEALQFKMPFRINMVWACALADAIHAREMETRPFAEDDAKVDEVVAEAEEMMRKAFRKRGWLVRLPRVMKAVSKMFDDIPRHGRPVPKVFVTGEFFANHANGDGNYHVRAFIMNEGCQVSPSLMCERIQYDFHRRLIEFNRQLAVVGTDEAARKKILKSIKKNNSGQMVTRLTSDKCLEWIGAKCRTANVEDLANHSKDFYSERAFGGEGNLEVAEAMEAVEQGYDGFVTLKPFGCMPSSGVSDGVQAKVQDMFPSLNYLSVETSGDNAANILNRVSMMVFRAKQNFARKQAETDSHPQADSRASATA